MTLEQLAKRSLLRVVDAYQAVQPVTDGVLSKQTYGSSWFVEMLRANAKTPIRGPASGPSFGLRKYDEIVAWFEDHWPVGAVWPEDVIHNGKLSKIPVTTRRKVPHGEDGKGEGKIQGKKGGAKAHPQGSRRKAA